MNQDVVHLHADYRVEGEYMAGLKSGEFAKLDKIRFDNPAANYYETKFKAVVLRPIFYEIGCLYRLK